jgi:DNA-binding transcriptional LysR family regulator
MAEPRIETLDMQVVLTVARLGSFSAAAAELRMAAPSVSARMASLERRLGARLFERRARGSALTPEGQRFVGYARRCIDLLDEARAEVGASPVKRLVLAAPHSLAGTVLPLALESLARRSIAVHGLVAHSREIIELVDDGTAHAGFVLTQVPTGGLASERLGASPLLAVVGVGHPLAGQDEVTFADLRAHPLVVYRWDAEGEPVARAFDDPARLPTQPVHTTGSPEAALQLAADAGWVAVVPRFAAARAVRAGSCVPLALNLPDWTVDIRLLHPIRRGDRDGVAALLDTLPELRDRLLGSLPITP